jgi:iron-sulfur cluster repair protein YtfE (RIC family)
MDPSSGPAVSTPATRTGMAVGEVRARVLADHAKLRAAIAEVDRLALAVAAEELKHIDALRTQAENLYRMLQKHIDHEDAVLAPIIRRIDAWGPVRHEQMKSDHANQRATLAQAIRDLDSGGPALGKAVQSMCWEILHDMRREEHDLLHPDLWREDITLIEFGG